MPKKKTMKAGPKPVSQKVAKKKIAAIKSPSRDIRKPHIPIVGIGASAGGFESFFKKMPENSGIAFSLASLLDPIHASILPEIIQKKTKIKVQQVKDSMKVFPNQPGAIC